MKGVGFTEINIRKTINGEKNMTRRLKQTFRVGETLFIRETFYLNKTYDDKTPKQVCLKGDFNVYFEPNEFTGRKRLARFMPEKMARHFINIISHRREYLQDISCQDALCEGCKDVDEFKRLFISLHGEDIWHKNPIVNVYTYNYGKNDFHYFV